MVGCIFSLMGGKMNTKRLVLGFCALAAVTVGAPKKVFGAEDFVDATGVDRLTQGQMERLRRAKQEVAQMVAANSEKVARMGRYEVSCVSRCACRYNCHANILFWIVSEGLAAVTEIRSKLAIALERAERAWFPWTKWRANAEVGKLRLELAAVTKPLGIAWIEAANSVSKSVKKYQEFKKEALGWRERRLAYFTERASVCSCAEGGYGVGLVIEDKDARVAEVNTRYAADEAIAESITDVIHNSTNDYWLSDYGFISCDRDLFSKSRNAYEAFELGYDYTDLSRFKRQKMLVENDDNDNDDDDILSLFDLVNGRLGVGLD
jgi:hypothetical protein